MCKTCKKIKIGTEYRCFLGIPFGFQMPHFSTFSKNYERRFKDIDIFENNLINDFNQAIGIEACTKGYTVFIFKFTQFSD